MIISDQENVKVFLETRSEQSFRVLYHAHTGMLFRIAFRICDGNKVDAEELVQETWCVAVRKLETFEWRSQLRTWLTAILLNLSKAYLRKQTKTPFIEDIGQVEQSAVLEHASVLDLERALAQLPQGYRQVIILHDIEGYKHYEIAEMLNLSEGTSKSQLFHARRLMRRILSA